MKNVLYVLALIAIASVSCNVPPGVDEENEFKNSGLAPSSSVFEGEWTWLETKGEGIAGPYEQDSVSAGYSWRLKFYESEGKGGAIVYYKDYTSGQKEECTGTYTYSDSDTSAKLDYACNGWLNNNRWENYIWEMKVIDEKLHLYLRNVEDCCDNTFEHHFVLTKEPNL